MLYIDEQNYHIKIFKVYDKLHIILWVQRNMTCCLLQKLFFCERNYFSGLFSRKCLHKIPKFQGFKSRSIIDTPILALNLVNIINISVKWVLQNIPEISLIRWDGAYGHLGSFNTLIHRIFLPMSRDARHFFLNL